MNYRVLCLPGPDPMRVAMIASVFLGLDGCVIIIRLGEDVLLCAWLGKGGKVFPHDLEMYWGN